MTDPGNEWTTIEMKEETLYVDDVVRLEDRYGRV
jgi:hypothetical protein